MEVLTSILALPEGRTFQLLSSIGVLHVAAKVPEINKDNFLKVTLVENSNKEDSASFTLYVSLPLLWHYRVKAEANALRSLTEDFSATARTFMVDFPEYAEAIAVSLATLGNEGKHWPSIESHPGFLPMIIFPRFYEVTSIEYNF